MINKLLNFSKNLIISLGLVVIIMMMFFTTSSYAVSGYTLGSVMRQTISVWYLYILRISISIYIIGYLVIIIKLLMERTPEHLKILKESISHFIIMFIIISALHYIMIAIITINNEALDVAKSVGTVFSGIDMKEDEYDLYETALSKAYELASVPGIIGLLMYLLLVYYTYKFAFVYAKRYINVVVLILLAPIIFVLSTIKRILTGVRDGKVVKWFKEFIFNVIIQTFHAIFYAILIGLTLRLSDSDENLIGALLTLIIFGFIFKIDAIIRKIFNFVGGSTKISKSKAVGEAMDVVGGAIDGGFSGIKENMQQMPDNLKQKAITAGVDIKNKALDAYNNAKIDIKDYKNILNGERVKNNLKKDELVAAMHDLEKNKGLMGLRNKIQRAGMKASAKTKKIGELSSKRLAKVYSTVSGNTKIAIYNAQKQMEHDVNMLDNNVETVKRLYKFVKRTSSFKKKRMKIIQNREGMNVDVTNTMMLVVDTEVSPEELIANVREQLGEGLDVSVYAFEKIGAQIFLSPVVGSPRMGMAVLAEDNYEKIAEHRIEEAVTGRKRKKSRVIKKASVKTSKQEIKRAGKVLKKDKKTFKKAYKFSRFNPKASRKITKRMLKKSREQNRYIITINKAYDDIQINDMRVRGRVSKQTTEIRREERLVRKTKIRTIRQVKLSQTRSIEGYRKVERQARRVESANRVGCQVMTAKNVIKLGFKQIDQMTPGQIGLRNMIKEGKVKELTGGLVAVRQKATIPEKVKATGIVKAEDKNLVLQIVVAQSGELFKQIVSTEGKIVQPAVNKKGQMIQTNVEKPTVARKVKKEKVHATGNVEKEEVRVTGNVEKEEVREEQVIQRVVTFDGKIVQQVVKDDGTIDPQSYQIVSDGGETLVKQIKSVVSNEDLGLEETATADEKFQKLEELLEDVKRTSSTQPLLDQLIEQSTPEERELDEILVSAMEESGISSMSELKQHMFLDETAPSDEEFQKKSDMFRQAVTQQMVSTGIVTSEESEDEDVMQDAFNVLNARVEKLDHTDVLLDTAAEMERTKIVADLINQGATSSEPPTEKEIDAKMGDLSDLLKGLAKDYVMETTKFPRGVLNDTAQYMTEIMDNAAEATKSKAELAFEAELERAEQRWAKKYGEEADEDIAEKYSKKEKGKEEQAEIVKISLMFFGGVVTQGQVVTLSNKHSIKNFYDKVDKLDNANLTKTQERFLQIYGEKLEKMQLMPFSFAKHPVEDMDNWCIYVVTDEEDTTKGEKEKRKPESEEEIRAKELINLYYIDVKRIFTEFIIENEIMLFDNLYKDKSKYYELVKRYRLLLFRKGEKNEQAKAKAVVNYLRYDVRFKNILKESEPEILAKVEGEDRRAKAKATVKVKSKKEAEKEASSKITAKEVSKFKKEAKEDLMSQVLDDVVSEEEETARITRDEDLRRLLNELNENKAYISLDQGNTSKNRKTLEFETGKREVMP